MLGAFQPVGVFMFYAGLNAIAFVMIYFLVPETKALSLEELDSVFSVSHKDFINHVVTKETPYWARRWIKWERDVPKPAPLLELDSHVVAAALTGEKRA